MLQVTLAVLHGVTVPLVLIVRLTLGAFSPQYRLIPCSVPHGRGAVGGCMGCGAAQLQEDREV